ncbi:MAG: zf-HC2 domain-containing protein, partial [Candidatus Sulfotelmatobacter sp.]
MPELPNIVRERLKVSRTTSSHPEADVLTAFAERALPKSERAVVAEHLARCHDCRDVLALALPATVTVETARVPLPARGGWLRAPVLRWGVVAAGLAVLAVTGLLQYQRGRGPRSSVAEIQRYETPASEGKAAPAGQAGESAKLTPGAPSALAEPANAVPANASRANASAAIASNADARLKKEGAAARNETEMLYAPRKLSVAAPTAGLPLHGRNAAGGSAGGRIHGSLPLFAKQAPSSAGKIETQSQLVATNTPAQAPSRAFMDVTVDKAKAPQTTTVEVSAEAPVFETATAAPALSPIPGASWGISASGGLLRSFDQGRTWASVDVNASFPGASQMVTVIAQ